MQLQFDPVMMVKPRQIQLPYGPTCRLRLGRAAYDGVLHAAGIDLWAVTTQDRRLLRRLREAEALSLSLACDGSGSGLRLSDFTVDEEIGRILFRLSDPLKNGAEPTWLEHSVSTVVRAPCLFRRVAEADLAAVSPFELVLRLIEPDGFLVPSAVISLEVHRPWGGRFNIRGRVVHRAELDGGSQLVIRPERVPDKAAAGWLAVCESDTFGIRQLRMNGLSARGAGRFLRISRCSTVADWHNVVRLRRIANQFFGRHQEADDDTIWTDELDDNSLSLLVWLGRNPVGTGRLVFNGGDRRLSEIEASSPLPDWVWAERFLEVSRVAIDADHRSAGVMIAIFQEVGRIALETNCRYLVLDAIEKLVPIYEKVGAVHLPNTKKHPFSDETVHVMVIDIRRSLTSIDRRLLYWLAVFGPALRSHLRLFGARHTRAILNRGIQIGFTVKQALARALFFRSI
ncbi:MULTISPECIES: GNAT family N-acetyltransferase [Rhizobium]|uniref:N-acetyltransferase domain-containing protein n=1 Tax=Rhizobium favelukesii TaxID=348824 RepID=W6RFJ0_9HYPH|nr:MULTISPECIES: GNAT family N-acetyltransferase [Rhizobium]MCS0463456.1 GNAT family N-acetyltransferase [Rhizobium favelukesii]UFS85082.1 GNAT family N-acetyltransferase [Rhizobium sp. T136]CDM60012.1 hypothetical protein LPU83_pLPU83b_0012 [Rhizobium favelukesii]